MAKKRRQARSIRGEIVDFDLFDIKSQMSNQPKSVEVRAREDFIESRLRRRKSRLERNRKAQLEATTKAQEKKEKIEPVLRETPISEEKAIPPVVKEKSTIEETPVFEEKVVKPKTRRIKKKKVE